MKKLMAVEKNEVNWEKIVDSFPIIGEKNKVNRSGVNINNYDLYEFIEKILIHTDMYTCGILPYLEKTFRFIEDRFIMGKRKRRISKQEFLTSSKIDFCIAELLRNYWSGPMKKAANGNLLYGTQHLRLNIPDKEGLSENDKLMSVTVKELKKELLIFFRREGIIVGKVDNFEWYTIKGGE